MNLFRYVESKYPQGFVGKFMAFGEPLIDHPLLQAGWMGVAVRPLDSEFMSPAGQGEEHLSLTRIRGQLSTDSGFRRVMSGGWVRVFTPREVFDQFAGPHHLISLNTGLMDRWIWDTAQVQASAPHVYLMPEDGHNEAVRELAAKRKYYGEVVGDTLVLVHEGGHDYCEVCRHIEPVAI